MSIDPRTPILVGAGQILQRLSDDPDALDKAQEPVVLMEAAARRAAEDAGCPALLAQLDSIRVPRGLWPYANPAWLLRDTLGASSAETAIAPISGNSVQRMVTDAAREIVAGRRDAVLVVGGETERTKRRSERAGRELGWDEREAPAPDRDFDDGGEAILPEELDVGIAQPAAMFSLYENARRHAAGESLAANRDRIARLWHGFARVAERNPYAWTREAPSVETIRDETPDNRMISWPYTKRLCSNMVVDMAAAVIVCSVERARRLGIPRDRWVFLHAATDCKETPQLSHRHDFLHVPALELAGRRVLELAGLEAADLGPVDLYSCFPVAVQVAAEALGLSLDRPLTVTGGLAYAGGPFNSYVLHSIATTIARLREEPDRPALVSGVGGFFAKHAFGVYSSEPSETGFQYADLDAEARTRPTRESTKEADGEVQIETYALRHRGGEPARAIFACLLEDGRRTWAYSEDPEVLREMRENEVCGRSVRLDGGRLTSL